VKTSRIVVAGATGHLGGMIVSRLLDRGAAVRALVRRGSGAKAKELVARGAELVAVEYQNHDAVARACTGASCIVSALSGLHETIVDAQSALLDAAVRASVPRFIPSDYAIDFYKLPDGRNRNLDLRREFSRRLDAAPIAATSILNGMFMELLAGQAPFLIRRFHRAVYWGSAEQLMDFTTSADTAAFTAAAALDPSTPRFLRIAGDIASARRLARIASEVTGEPFKLLRAGPLSRLGKVIAVAKLLAPARDNVYPPWQGMQYMRDMFDGRAKLESLDNDRYPELRWTPIRDVLSSL